MMDRRAYPFRGGHNNFAVFVVRMFSSKSTRKAACMREGFPEMKTTVLQWIVTLMFPEEAELRMGRKPGALEPRT